MPSTCNNAASTPSRPALTLRPTINRVVGIQSRRNGQPRERSGGLVRLLQEAVENLPVERRGGFVLGVPLQADAEPVAVGMLDGLDHAVERPGRHPQLAAE